MSPLGGSTLGLLVLSYGLIGIVLHWGYRNGHAPEEVGAYVVFGSALFMLVLSLVLGIVHLLAILWLH